QRAVLETIARQGRAFGISLVVTTHYPTADILTSQIQANLDARVVLTLPVAQATVALGVTRLQHYDPSCLPPRSGAVIYRPLHGEEQLGRIPALSEQQRLRIIARLVNWYGRPLPAQPEASVPVVLEASLAHPVEGTRRLVITPEERQRIIEAAQQYPSRAAV